MTPTPTFLTNLKKRKEGRKRERKRRRNEGRKEGRKREGGREKCAQDPTDSDKQDWNLNLGVPGPKDPAPLFHTQRPLFGSVINKLCDLRGEITPLAPVPSIIKKRSVRDL